MSAPLREQFANNAQDTLDGGIDDTQTTIDLNDASEFPATGNFRLRIDANDPGEICLCTSRSGNTLTVVRGYEGSTPASHSDSTQVALVVTTGNIERWAKDNVPLWGDVPPVSKIADDNGAIITASGFSWTGQGTATVTDQNGTIVMRCPGVSGDNFRIQRRAAPATPFSYIAAFQAVGYRSGGGGSVPNFGIGFRDSSNGKFVATLVLCDGTSGHRLQVSNLTNETTFNSNVAGRDNYVVVGHVLWLKIEDDGTNLKFYMGDGLEWIQVASVGRTVFTSALDQVFWFGNNVGAGADFLVRLVHWSRAS